MSQQTTIEWTDATWNPIRGCSRVSEGCRNCYAEKVATRFSGAGQPYEGLIAKGGQWSGQIKLLPEKLGEPLRWNKPRRVFVNSMSDLFHESTPDDFIDQIFAAMAVCPQHTFQILTKRPQRMLRYLTQKIPSKGWPSGTIRKLPREWFVGGCIKGHPMHQIAANKSVSWLDRAAQIGVHMQHGSGWPLSNVWLGVSVEDQATADERIPLLLQTPAAIRWISAEPLLDQIDIKSHLPPEDNDEVRLLNGHCVDPLDWVVVGGESGPGARPFEISWARGIVEQCQSAGTPVFVKQLGSNPYHGDGALKLPVKLRDRKGGDPSEWPSDLRLRQMIEVNAWAY